MYNSTYTIHLPSEIREEISRRITIKEESILIQSYQETEPVHNQLLIINEVTEDRFYDGIAKSYHCVSQDEKSQYIVRIMKESPEVIIVIEPPNTLEKGKVYNLVLEND